MLDAEVGMPLTLDAAGTRDPDGQAVAFEWFFYPEAGAGIPGQPVFAPRPPSASPPTGNPGEGGIPSAPVRRTARGSGQGGRRQRQRLAGRRDAEGGRDRPRHRRRGGRRHAEPHVVSAHHPEYQASADGVGSFVRADMKLEPTTPSPSVDPSSARRRWRRVCCSSSPATSSGSCRSCLPGFPRTRPGRTWSASRSSPWVSPSSPVGWCDRPPASWPRCSSPSSCSSTRPPSWRPPGWTIRTSGGSCGRTP